MCPLSPCTTWVNSDTRAVSNFLKFHGGFHRYGRHCYTTLHRAESSHISVLQEGNILEIRELKEGGRRLFHLRNVLLDSRVEEDKFS